MGFDGSDPARPLLAVAGGGDSLLSPDALPPETRAALRNGTANVAAALPPGVALLVPIELPALPQKKLREILPHLLAAKLPFPLSECLVRFDLPELNSATESANVWNNANSGAEFNYDMGGLGTVGSDHGDPQCYTEGLLPYGDGHMTQRMGIKQSMYMQMIRI